MLPKKIILLFLCLFAYAHGLFAQATATVYGTIIDKEKNPIEFVSVSVLGLPGATQTDAKGKYSLEVPAGKKIKVAFSEMLLGDTVYYTLEEYILHLEYILLLLEKYENFHVYFTNGETEAQYIVYAREELGAIVAKTSTPPVVLAINEANLATAFWDFLRSMIAEKPYQYPNNKESAKMLADYIQRIKQSQE